MGTAIISARMSSEVASDILRIVMPKVRNIILPGNDGRGHADTGTTPDYSARGPLLTSRS